MQIEALGICNLSISRCSALALAFQGESWNNQAALIHCGEKKRKNRLQMWRASQWRVFTPAAAAAVVVALPQITTCPLDWGSASRCYSGTASSTPVWRYFSQGFFFFVPPCPRRSAWCHREPLPQSAQTVCTWNLLYLTSLIRFGVRGAQLLCTYI